jgi:hypothetical protein
MHLKFVETESTFDYFQATREYLEQEQNLVILQGQAVGNRPLLAPGEDVSEVVAG